MNDVILQQRSGLGLFPHIEIVVVVLFGPVSHSVGDRLGVRPEPGDRPQQASECERQEAKRVDRVLLRMMALLGDLLRQDVDQPEQDDDNDRHDADDEPRNDGRCRIERLAGKERRRCGCRSRERAKRAREPGRTTPSARHLGQSQSHLPLSRHRA